jgi:cation diffusion facilitator family transporter
MDDGRAAEARIAVISAVTGTVLLGSRYLAYQVTGATAVFADALVTIISVIATLFGWRGLVVAGWPAERVRRPDHGKVEFFRAVFEAGMLAVAAVLIIKEAGEAFISGHQVRAVRLGLFITAGAGLADALAGWLMIYFGKRFGSAAATADGTRMLSDFWTSAVAAVALALVLLTGKQWFDPLAATIIGLHLVWIALGLVRLAAGGLLDEEDIGVVERVLDAINTNLIPGVIRIQGLRAARSGRCTRVDARLVVPEFWTVEEADDFARAFEHRIMRGLSGESEVSLRPDPCHRQFCAACEVDPCPIRVQPFVGRTWIRLDDAMRSDPSQ